MFYGKVSGDIFIFPVNGEITGDNVNVSYDGEVGGDQHVK